MKLIPLTTALFALLFLLGCTKDEESNPTTYEIINDMPLFESSMEYLDGTLYEVIVYHYIGDDIAKQESIDPIAYGGGTTGKIDIENNIDKIKVSFKPLPRESAYYDLSANSRNYVVGYTFIKKGSNNVIHITSTTQVSGSISKSASINPLFKALEQIE